MMAKIYTCSQLLNLVFIHVVNAVLEFVHNKLTTSQRSFTGSRMKGSFIILVSERNGKYVINSEDLGSKIESITNRFRIRMMNYLVSDTGILEKRKSECSYQELNLRPSDY